MRLEATYNKRAYKIIYLILLLISDKMKKALKVIATVLLALLVAIAIYQAVQPKEIDFIENHSELKPLDTLNN